MHQGRSGISCRYGEFEHAVPGQAFRKRAPLIGSGFVVELYRNTAHHVVFGGGMIGGLHRIEIFRIAGEHAIGKSVADNGGGDTDVAKNGGFL